MLHVTYVGVITGPNSPSPTSSCLSRASPVALSLLHVDYAVETKIIKYGFEILHPEVENCRKDTTAQYKDVQNFCVISIRLAFDEDSHELHMRLRVF